MTARKPDVADYRAYPDRTGGAERRGPAPVAPTPEPPLWCYVQAEELRKYVREHDAEDSEGELAWALWEASKR